MTGVVTTSDQALFVLPSSELNSSVKFVSVTGQETLSLQSHANGITGLSWSPDGKRMVGGGDTSATVWDVATGKEVLTLTGAAEDFPGMIFDAAFSPAGNRIALWLRDVTLDPEQPGEQLLMTVHARSGLIAAHPVDTSNNYADPYRFTRDGRSSGL